VATGVTGRGPSPTTVPAAPAAAPGPPPRRLKGKAKLEAAQRARQAAVEVAPPPAGVAMYLLGRDGRSLVLHDADGRPVQPPPPAASASAAARGGPGVGVGPAATAAAVASALSSVTGLESVDAFAEEDDDDASIPHAPAPATSAATGAQQHEQLLQRYRQDFVDAAARLLRHGIYLQVPRTVSR